MTRPTNALMPPGFVDLVAGARPNFVKLAPVVHALQHAGDLAFRVVHTGQHYDAAMSDVFFEQLRLPRPDVHLEVGSGPHGAQTGRILERYEACLLEGDRPRATVVFGDVNSTVACALAAVKLAIPVVHVEAGLRSGDRTMPEEINRILTDAIADLLLASEPAGVEHLAREGVDRGKVRLVGNVMIDSLRTHLDSDRACALRAQMGVSDAPYALLTLHRPANVDDPAVLEGLLRLFARLSKEVAIVFPAHPRTMAAVRAHGLTSLLSAEDCRVRVLEPMAYLDTIALASQAAVVFTDSGGLQEEASVLGVPCITLRDTTERPITVECGTCRLVGHDAGTVEAAFRDVLGGRWPPGRAIPLWDGETAGRITEAIREFLAGR